MKCEICLLPYSDLEIHHISKSGGEKKWNKIIICSLCHTLIHSGKITIYGKKLTTAGYRLIWHKSDYDEINELDKPDVYVYSSKLKKVI